MGGFEDLVKLACPKACVNCSAHHCGDMLFVYGEVFVGLLREVQ